MTNIERSVDAIAENQGAWYETEEGYCDMCMFRSMGCPGAERESEDYYTHTDCEKVFKVWAMKEAGV